MSASSPRPVRRRRWVLLGIVVAVLTAVVLLVFEPQTLFIDTRVDDAFPAAEPGATATAAAEASDGPTTAEPEPEPEPISAEPTEPVALAGGAFVSRDHATSGTATVYALPDGTRLLRFEDLVTDNGPDLKVYLSTAAPDAPATAFDEQFVDLGVLAGNLGNQNYDVPTDVDLTPYRSVVIWCDRFDVPFGAAPLS